MSDEYRERIAEFLSQYIDILDCKLGYGDERVIRQGIKLLSEQNIVSKSGLKKELMRQQGIVLTDDFIEKCLSVKVKEES